MRPGRGEGASEGLVKEELLTLCSYYRLEGDLGDGNLFNKTVEVLGGSHPPSPRPRNRWSPVRPGRLFGGPGPGTRVQWRRPESRGCSVARGFRSSPGPWAGCTGPDVKGSEQDPELPWLAPPSPGPKPGAKGP